MAVFLIFLSIAFILIGCIAFSFYIIFEKLPQLTEKTGATLQNRKHKRDVVIRSRRGPDMYVDHLVKCVYTYKVGEKHYVKRYTHYYCTFNQAPKSIPIVYIRKLPRISYVNTFESTSKLSYLFAGILNVFWGLMLLILTISIF